MSALEELEQRIAAVEERLNDESGLRGSSDRDLSDMAQTLRAQQHTTRALAITQSQHNDKLDRHEQSLTAAHGKLDQIIAMLGPGPLPAHVADTGGVPGPIFSSAIPGRHLSTILETARGLVGIRCLRPNCNLQHDLRPRSRFPSSTEVPPGT